MFRAFSSAARRDITVNIVVPTSGNLLVNRTSTLEVLQAAGERPYREAVLAQRPRRSQAAFTGGAYQQCLAAGGQPWIRQELLHGDMQNRPVSGEGGRARRHFLDSSNIDDLETTRRGSGQRIAVDFDVAGPRAPDPGCARMSARGTRRGAKL